MARRRASSSTARWASASSFKAAARGDGRATGLVEGRAPPFGLDLGDLPSRSRQGGELAGRGEVAGEQLQLVRDLAGGRLALREGARPRLVPLAVAALGGVGGV